MPLFVQRMIGVRHEEREWIRKYCRCFVKRYAVLPAISTRFLRVPLEYIAHSSLSLQSDADALCSGDFGSTAATIQLAST